MLKEERKQIKQKKTEQKNIRKQEKIQAKDKVWLEKYGVSYSEVADKVKVKKHKGFPKFKKLMGFYKQSKWLLAFIIFLGFLGGLISLLYPISMQLIIDRLTIGDFSDIFWFVVLYLGANVLGRTTFWLFCVLNEKTMGRVAYNIRVKLVSSICETKSTKFDTSSSGEIINRVTNDASTFTTHFEEILNFGIDVIMSLMYLFYAIFINVWLGLFMLGIGLYTFLIHYCLYIKRMQKMLYKRNLILTDRNTSDCNELTRGIKDIRYLNIKENFQKRIAKTAMFRYSAMYNHLKTWQFIYSIRDYGEAILTVLFLLFGIYLVGIGSVSVGAFVVILIYRYSIFGIFTNMASIVENIQKGEVVAERMCEILENEEFPKEEFGNEELKRINGKIEFRNVNYSYKEDEPLFENLNFVVQPNECIGIVGKSGQGKSTIISLISKLYELQSGEILFDDVDIKNLTENSLRDNISTVPQSPYIFNLSIKENLLLAKSDATQEELEEVCKKAFIHDFIITKPKGYDTIVGEGGITLSGGQKQRLAIARVLLKNSKIILLDEATSALDNESQKKIKKTIKAMKENKTILIVAHRLTTVKDCDRIFVMDGNQIVASGKHRTLMTTCEVYKNLYQNEEEE